MEAEAVALIIASIGGCIASVIYSFKHIKKSECCGSKCTQVVMEEGAVVSVDSSPSLKSSVV